VPARPLNVGPLSTAMQALDYRIPKDDQRVEPPYVPISRTQLNVAFALVAAVLSIASLFVVMQGANDEPYGVYRRYDAVVQVGIGTALMVLWGCCALAVVVLVAARKLPVWWLALLLWAAICLFYLSYSPFGYLADIENHVIPAAGGGGG
jgi:peptidoglycan/LPS O-acetylase OafA/YrhL